MRYIGVQMKNKYPYKCIDQPKVHVSFGSIVFVEYKSSVIKTQQKQVAKAYT